MKTGAFAVALGAAAFVGAFASPVLARSAAASNDDVRARIIQESIASYSGSCPCPYNTMRNGRRCGGRSAYTWDNAYLFPGRTVGSHLTEAAVTYYLKKQGVTADQLFATAIHQAYLSGVRHPKILVRALGISTVTAIKYLNLIDPRLRDEVEARAHG